MGSFSSDGLHMVAVSTAYKGKKYNINDMKLIVVNLIDWSWRDISSSDGGVNIFPFYSQSGEKMFYFKGVARSEGATPASQYDLYVSDLVNGKSEKLTRRSFYQVSKGDVSSDGNTVFFSWAGGKKQDVGSYNATNEYKDGSGIAEYDLVENKFKTINLRDNGLFIDVYHPRLDFTNSVYFLGITRDSKRDFLFSLFKWSDNGARRMATLSSWSRFDIVKRTGDVVISDVQNDELVFRRLARIAR